MPTQLDLISVTPDGFSGNYGSADISILASAPNASISRLIDINANGRYVAFASSATDLETTDTNTITDLFVRDLAAGTTTLVSVNSSGTNGGNDGSYDPIFSNNGRYVAFTSFASDLVANDTNGASDVFVRDVVTGTTTLISVNSSGTGSGTGSLDIGLIVSSLQPVISGDGRYVAFESYANDLVTNDTNDKPDVFVRDVVTGTTTLVSVNSNGTGSGNGFSVNPMISSNGRYVAFTSTASDLVTNGTNNGKVKYDAFVRDLQTGTTSLVSVNSSGNGSGNGYSFIQDISDDGRYVLFTSQASDLVTNDTNGKAPDVFVRDLVTGTTTLVTVNSSGTGSGNDTDAFLNVGESAVLSSNGRYVAFGSAASNLVPNDTNGKIDVFVRDLVTNTTTLVSVNNSGTDSANNTSYISDISDDGRYVVFSSYASDLVPNTPNPQYGNVFVRDLSTGTTTLVSVDSSGISDGVNVSLLPVISNNGSYIAFSSLGTGLVAGDTNGASDGYGFRLDTTNPTADILDVSPDPRDRNVSSITVQFSEAVNNFDLTDLSLTRDGSSISLAGATLTTSDNITWTLGNLDGFTTDSGSYQLTLATSDINDAVGNALAASVSDTWLTGSTGIARAPIDFNEGRRGIQRRGTGGSDRLFGTGGNDVLEGLDGSDRLSSGDGNDQLKGGSGNDWLNGGNGNDLVQGGDDSDRLRGGNGDDVLVGGTNSDTLAGGGGNDLFVFNSLNEGGDIITDFDGITDLIDLRSIFTTPAFGGANPFAQFVQFIQLVQVGANTQVRIDADGNGSSNTFSTLATLENVTVSGISSHNFAIVGE